MTSTIVKLRPHDHVQCDPVPIARIYREMGADAADLAVNRAMGELALTIAAAAKMVVERNLADMPRQLRRIARMANHLGLSTICATAADAQSCLEDFDATAFAAIWARLIRVAGSQLASGPEAQGRRV